MVYFAEYQLYHSDVVSYSPLTGYRLAKLQSAYKVSVALCGPVLSSNIQTEACLDLTGTGTTWCIYKCEKRSECQPVTTAPANCRSHTSSSLIFYTYVLLFFKTIYSFPYTLKHFIQFYCKILQIFYVFKQSLQWIAMRSYKKRENPKRLPKKA
jgi:hypothetical protein